jgi:hypothetical protein
MSYEADDDEAAEQRHEDRIRRCRSCNARIIWLKTQAGKNMPVDADTVDHDETEFDPAKHVSHFSSCPNANQHRKARK